MVLAVIIHCYSWAETAVHHSAMSQQTLLMRIYLDKQYHLKYVSVRALLCLSVLLMIITVRFASVMFSDNLTHGMRLESFYPDLKLEQFK